MQKNEGETIHGEYGADKLIGGDGDDVIHAGGGNDVIIGCKGDDKLYGGNENDKYVWTNGDGNDFISDWHGNNLIKLIDVNEMMLIYL